MGDLVRFWYGALFLFASAYTLFDDGHVRVDVLYSGFRDRAKGKVNSIGAILLGIIFCWVVIILGMENKSSIINAPLIGLEVTQNGFGMFVKYLMAGFLGGLRRVDDDRVLCAVAGRGGRLARRSGLEAARARRRTARPLTEDGDVYDGTAVSCSSAGDHGGRAGIRLSGCVRFARFGDPLDADRRRGGVCLRGRRVGLFRIRLGSGVAVRGGAEFPWRLLGGRTRYADRHPAVRLHGHHAAAVEDRRGPAADHGAAIRADPGRPGHLGGVRRRAPGRDHGDLGRDRGRDGPDLAARDAAQQLFARRWRRAPSRRRARWARSSRRRSC